MSDDISNIFSKMSDRRDIVYFVREIEKNPCLYDQNSYQYANKELKRRIWLDIAKKCHSSVPDCKEKWRKIRIAYMRSLKQCHGDNPPSRPYYLSSYLHFITPSKYADNMPTTNSVLSPNPSEESFKITKTKDEIDEFDDDDDDSNDRLEVVDHTNETLIKEYQKPIFSQKIQDSFEKIHKKIQIRSKNSNSFQVDTTNTSLTEINDRSQVERNNRLLPETSNMPQTEVNNIPQMEMNNRYQTEINSRSQIVINNRHQTEINDRSQVEINNRPQIEIGNRAKLELNNREQTERNNRHQTEISNGHLTELSNRSQMEIDNRHQTEINDRSQVEIHNRHKTEINDRAKVEITKTILDKSTDINANIPNRKRSSCCDESRPRKMFLLSLLPDVETLTDHEMRTFRREVIGLIDNIVTSRDSVLINLSNKIVKTSV